MTRDPNDPHGVIPFTDNSNDDWEEGYPYDSDGLPGYVEPMVWAALVAIAAGSGLLLYWLGGVL